VVIEMSLATEDGWAEAEATSAFSALLSNDVDIEVVCMGEGAPMLSRNDTGLREALQRDAAAGVVFAACERSMRARKLKTEDMFPFVRQVPSGVAEVVMKQEAGLFIPEGQLRGAYGFAPGADPPINSFLPSAKVSFAPTARFAPSLDWKPSTTISVPGGSESLENPAASRAFGLPPSIIQGTPFTSR